MAETTPTTEESIYDVKVEDVGPAKKRLTITVPAEVIGDKIEESIGTLATQAAVPGFRKGKVPRKLLERRFGSTVRNETKNQVVADAYAGVIEEKEIRPVGEPEPVDKIEELELEEGKPLTFAVDVEVVPEFDLPELENIEIRKPMLEITDEQIEEELNRNCLQMGEAEEIRSDFQPGDRLVGPGSATKEGEDEPFFRHDNIDIIVPGDDEGGRGQVLGLLIDDLASKLRGLSVGETFTVETVGPEGHELEHIRGEKLTIEVTIREAQRITPASVEQVVEHYGMASEQLLREQIRIALEQRRDEQQRGAMREQVHDYLLDAVDFDLPEKLSAAQATRMVERQRLELLYQGMPVEEVEERLAELRAEAEAASQRRLKLSFILNRLARHFEVEVSDQEVNGRIAAIAMQRGVRPDQLRTELVQSNRLGELASQIRENKAADRVIDRANVTEIPAEEWNKAARDKRDDSDGKETKKKKKKKTTTGKKTSKKSGKKTSKKKTSGKADEE
ncbi:MAG: trigger factor [Planctomycetota bacterium]|nr:trigger factor [Planctomycetota bacterium]